MARRVKKERGRPTKEEARNAKLSRTWSTEIELAEKALVKWEERAKKIVRRYRGDEYDSDRLYGYNSLARYNIFWSNIQTLQPSLYARTPKPEVRRRFRDKDPLGRVASEILERALTFSLDAYDFDSVMHQVRDDYLIVGRGSAWVRYVPHFETKERIIRLQLGQLNTQVDNEPEKTPEYFDENGQRVDNKDVLTDDLGPYVQEEYEEVVYEEVMCDFVQFEDFLHSPARNWEEVRWVARRCYMTRDELAERFGAEIAEDIPLTHAPTSDDSYLRDAINANIKFKKACVFEIWDKTTKKVYWVSKNYPYGPLDEADDPLKLTNFFPCPRPLYATTTTNSLVPICDFQQYQDQAYEIDEVTGRIHALVKALKVRGVYDASQEGIKRLLSESSENELIPVDNWPQVANQGGLKGVVDFMPIKEIAEVLTGLYQIREKLKVDLYEITGISDIIRGSTKASETATAQQIKGQFATLRLADRQKEIQRFARDLISLKGELIAEHFSPQTLRLMSGVDFINEESMMLFNQAVLLLKQDVLRQFRIDIETDSTIAIDDAREKETRVEFLNGVGQFLHSAGAMMEQMPSFAPVMGELLLYGVRAFDAGQNLEKSLEDAIEAQKQKLAQPQPDPAQVEAQHKMQLNEAKAQAKAQIDMMKLQVKAQSEQTQSAIDIERAKSEILLERAKLEANIQLQAEKIRAEMALKALETANQTAGSPKSEGASEKGAVINLEPPGKKKFITFTRNPATGQKMAEVQEVYPTKQSKWNFVVNPDGSKTVEVA